MSNQNNSTQFNQMSMNSSSTQTQTPEIVNSSESAYPSLYVPIIGTNISQSYIISAFENNEIGKVIRVDFVQNMEKNRREAFIHFEEWFTNDKAANLKKDVLDPITKTRFKYTKTDNFWPLLINKNPDKKVNNPKYEIISEEQLKEEHAKNLTKFTETMLTNTPHSESNANAVHKKTKQ